MKKAIVLLGISIALLLSSCIVVHPHHGPHPHKHKKHHRHHHYR